MSIDLFQYKLTYFSEMLTNWDFHALKKDLERYFWIYDRDCKQLVSEKVLEKDFLILLPHYLIFKATLWENKLQTMNQVI